jgi:hypothetical protein
MDRADDNGNGDAWSTPSAHAANLRGSKCIAKGDGEAISHACMPGEVVEVRAT